MEQSLSSTSFTFRNVKQPKNFWTSFALILGTGGLFCFVQMVFDSFTQALGDSKAGYTFTFLASTIILMVISALMNPGEFPKIVAYI